MSEYVGDNYVVKSKRKEILGTVVGYLNDEKIRWTLMCGTLLGCMREKDFIDWDFDIDIGIIGNDFKKINIKYFIDIGFKGLESNLLFKKTAILKDGCNIDFYHMKEKNNYYLFDISNSFQYKIFNKISLMIKKKKGLLVKRVNGLNEGYLLQDSILQVFQNILTLPKYKYFPKCELIEYTFVGILVFIPSCWEDWLILLYGNNWNIPNPSYSDSMERQMNRRKKKL